MKVMEVLRFFAALYGVPEADATGEVEDWLERFRIPDYRDRRVEELSKGNQQKIQFIAAILHDPEVLIMDEPFSGLDPVNVQLLKEAFLQMVLFLASALWLAARVYSAGVLLYGQRANLRSVWRAVRVDR
jgi:ABC-type uncharacterized transport system ATPase subunit